MSSIRADNMLAAASSSPSVAEEKNVPPVYPFRTWSNEEISALHSIGLDEHYQDIITNMIALMNEWIHLHDNGWYRSQNQKLNVLLEANTNKKRPLDIQLGLQRYLETANKLQKPKHGQVERRQLPTSLKFIEKFVNVYRTFWGNCTHDAFYNFLLALSRKPPEEWRNGKDKLYIYALLKLKEQELPRLQTSSDEARQLMIDIDKVLLVILSKCHTEKSFFITDEEAFASLDIAHEVIPKCLKLQDLHREFESSSARARYAHVRPATLIQFAQIIDYIYKVFEDAATDKRSLFKTYTEIDKGKTKAVLDRLDAKRKEIAGVMAFHEKLALSYGSEDFIEDLQSAVDNKSVKLLPTEEFFQFEANQIFTMGEFDEADLDAPTPIKLKDHREWRRRYINRHADEATREITPIPSEEVNAWLQEQAAIKNHAVNQAPTTFIATNVVRRVSVKNLEKHNLYLLSKLPDEEALRQAKYDDAYLFIKSPLGLLHVIRGKAKSLLIKSPKVFHDLVNGIKIKDESKPFHNLIDNNRLGLLQSFITLHEGHLHLGITRITIPAIITQALSEKPPAAASAASHDPLAGNRFFSAKNNSHDVLYDFFIARADERKTFLKVNDAISTRTLDFLLRQVDHGIDVTGLYSPHTMSLHKGPEGPVTNFSALIQALTLFGPTCDQELMQATAAMRKSKNSSHVFALGNYIASIEEARHAFHEKAKTILAYWTDQVKDIYPFPFRTITEFNRLLKDALTALGNQSMLDYFNARVYGAIILTEQDAKKPARLLL